MVWVEVDDETGETDIRIIGKATEAAIRLSTIDLTTYSGGHYRIALHDGTYNVWGYIGEADAGEVVTGELVTDGGFANWAGDDPVSWPLTVVEDGNNYVTQNAGTAQIVSDASIAIGIYQNITTVADKLYKITFTITKNTQGWRFGIKDAASAYHPIPLANFTTTGAQTFYFTANATTMRILFYRYPSVASDYQIDNVVCKNVTALGTDGVHIYQEPHLATQSWNGDASNINWNSITSLEIERWDSKTRGQLSLRLVLKLN